MLSIEAMHAARLGLGHTMSSIGLRSFCNDSVLVFYIIVIFIHIIIIIIIFIFT